MTDFDAVFRVDASTAIGGGHVRRCLSLADALTAAGWKIARSVYRNCVLSPGEDEAAGLRQRIPGGSTLLIVDHYSRGKQLEQNCRGWASHILAIDDLRRPHECDILLDQTPGRSPTDYAGLLPAECRVLVSAKYALLDPRFRAARRARPQTSSDLRRVLVSFGWTDPVGATALAVDALIRARLGVHVDVVLGADSPSLDRVRDLMSTLLPRAQLLTAVDDMAGLLRDADLAIGAGGVSALERCCVGVPSIIVPIADNQRGNAAVLAQRAAALVLPDVASLNVDDLAAAIRNLAADRKQRETTAAAGRELCDGWGTERVCGEILAHVGAVPARGNKAPDDLVIRPVLPEDAASVWRWRNEPAARSMSADDRPIPWETHRAWFEDRLTSPSTVMLIGSIGGEALGVLRFDREGDNVEVSITIAPDRRGQGWGGRLLRRGCAMIERSGFARSLDARIKPGNTASQRMFISAGFRLHATGEMDRYRRVPPVCCAVESHQKSKPPARKIG
jgi:UDP-2,4-diacetamido-2,4,6-trideoxy-beta-L-altropyranose hydrolase